MGHMNDDSIPYPILHIVGITIIHRLVVILR
jgi:hypothetical protein